MRVAVTGARGGVGKFVVQNLLDHGYQVRALTRGPWPACPGEAERIEGVDITDFDRLMEVFAGCDAIIHLANVPGDSGPDRPETFVNNMTGNYNVLLAAGLLGIEKLIIASSVCAMGKTYGHRFPAPDYFPLDEEHPPRPDDGYGISKYLSELMAERMFQRFPFMAIVSLRITWVIDPAHMRSVMEDSGCKTVERIDGNFGSYLDSRDCAEAFRLALEGATPGAEFYYVLNDEVFVTSSVHDYLKQYYPDVPLKQPIPEGQALESAQRFKKRFGWRAQHNWHEEYARLYGQQA